MYEWWRTLVLRLMKVPHEPEPPAGAPGSVRVFRAGLNHYHLRLARWTIGQSGALAGIFFSILFLSAVDLGIEQVRRDEALPKSSVTPARTPPSTPTPTATPVPSPTPALSAAEARRVARDRRNAANAPERRRVARAVIARIPPFLMPLIETLELLGIIGFAFQLAVTYMVIRLEYEQHWYIVTDRSLRIRTGIIRLQEATMSFANVQQVEIRQGPLQRLLGLADVCVRSAGGREAGPGEKGHGHEESLHLGVFKNVTNAVEIKDLIVERLRRFREAGLGDPDDRGHPASVEAPESRGGAADLAGKAVAELLVETRALRDVLLRTS